MAYKKSPQEQLNIIRQSSLNRAVDLYIAGKIEPGKLEETAEYFVALLYVRLDLAIGDAFTDDQTQGAIVFQSSLTRAVDLAIADIIGVGDIADSALLFVKYIYSGVKNG